MQKGTAVLRFLSRLSSATLLLSAPALAADPVGSDAALGAPKSTKTSFAPPGDGKAPPPLQRGTDSDALVFTSAPRENSEEGQKIYAPIAEYLGKVLGRKVVYRHPGTWGAYRSEMLSASYDIVFDGPHLNSYRSEKLKHNILVKVPGARDFAVITRKEAVFNTLAQLRGRTICTHAPPNLGTLILQSEFNNPARQPAIIVTEGWERIYRSVESGQCVAGVIPSATLRKLDTSAIMKIVYKSRPLPDQAFSAGPRLSADEQAKIAAALQAPEADKPLERLRAAHKIGERLVATNNGEYAGVGEYLRNEFGYY